MKIVHEEIARYPLLRLYFKTSKELAQTINRSTNYVCQRMSFNSGKNFTEIEKRLLFESIKEISKSDLNFSLIFSETYNPQDRNKLEAAS